MLEIPLNPPFLKGAFIKVFRQVPPFIKGGIGGIFTNFSAKKPQAASRIGSPGVRNLNYLVRFKRTAATTSGSRARSRG